ncbi:hypothetical protein [Streptomyces hundungensis]|uniref:hypothetical protein n=1 Tax=Streptomyces hundungensis TaxID=1077946 RepID=UPI0031F17E43
MLQVRTALALSFADPQRADDELALAHQLLDGVDQRANRLLAHITALIKDAGTPALPERAEQLRADIEAAGLPYLYRFLELALAFHHSVDSDGQALAVTIDRLHALTASGDFAHFYDIAHFMAGLSRTPGSAVRWLDGPDTARTKWRRLVTTRQHLLERGSRP